MDEDGATLSVGFAIDFHDSFGQLKSLDDLIGAAAANAVREFQKLEAATNGALNLSGATAQVSSFGNATSREMANATRETNKAEKAAEGMVRQIERQIEVFGKSSTEIRNMRAELRAVEAEERGLTELAVRLRTAAAEIDRMEASASQLPGTSNAARAATQNFGFQLQDFAVQVVGGTSVLRAFAMQAPQAAGALSGFEGKLGTVGAFLNGPWGIAITLGITLLAGFADKLFETNDAAEKAAEGLKKFQDRQSDIGNFIDATTGKLVEQNRVLVLNATLTRQAQIASNEKAIAESRDQAFDRARRAQFRAVNAAPGTTTSGVTFADDSGVQAVIKASKGDVAKLAEGLANLAKARPELAKVALDVSGIGGQAIIATRENENLRKELRALGGDANALGQSTAAIGRQVALATATSPLERARAQLAIVQEGATAADKAGGKALDKYRLDLTAATKAVNAAEAAEKAANAARRDGRRDMNHAEQLVREADAVEAQIRNLDGLADAYRVSGAAALVAEARVKAETQAIRQRADTDEALDRQIRLAVAQRTSDAARTSLAVREQADAQEAINAQVRQGLVPAERAAELVRDRITDLPLLAAIEVAQQRGLARETEQATKTLADQRAERERLRVATLNGQISASISSGNERLTVMREELRLIGETDKVRARSLATLQAQQESSKWKGADPAEVSKYVELQGVLAAQTVANEQAQRNYNDALTYTADRWDLIARNVELGARGMADAFGDVGRAIGGMASVYADFHADQERLLTEHNARVLAAGKDEAAIERENARFALANSTTRVGLYGDMASAAKGFFKEGSDGYQAMAAAEKAFRAVEFALSVRAMAQDAAETASSIAKSGARTATKAVEAVVSAISSLPFPLNLAAGAATIAALASIGVAVAGSFGGGKNTLEKANDGTGTVLGDATAKSDSIKRSIDALKEVDTVMLSYSRQMAASLSSIDGQIGNLASLVVRTGNINASGGVNTGFSQNTTGSVLENLVTGGGILSKIPIVGGIIGGIGSLIGSLFGTKTKVVASGLYGGSQSLDDILSGGFDASYYSDVQKKKKFFGLTTSTKYSTQYASADAGLESQFTLILRQFNNAIVAAAGPLGAATDDIQKKLNGFVLNIGKIDLQGLSGEEIEEKLVAVFGAAADDMAKAAFPGIEKFQAVGEGLFETLVRVASTVEAVTSSLDMLGSSASGMSVELKMTLAEQFDSVSDFTSAVGSYFDTYYTKAEQAAAQTAQFTKAFASLGLSMPNSLEAFRALVEAQDLTTAAGQSTYATLLQLAPAFADLQAVMNGAKSAADILSEREDLQRQLLEAQGDTAAIRALDLAKLDASNRALQQQVWALQDAKEAAEAAEQLKDAWTSVGNSIMDEVERIRGISDGSSSNSFATLLGQFNAATAAARGGDQDAAGKLTSLSQSLLTAAGHSATSKQELDRVKAQTAASLEATYAAITAMTGKGAASTSDTVAAAATAAEASAAGVGAANDDLLSELKSLRAEVARMREENTAGHAANARNTGAIKKHWDNVTGASSGSAVSVAGAA
jgi:copper chaperone CopZ